MSEQQRKLCQTTFHPTALPVGVSWLMPSSGGISSLTCTIFDPNIFLIFSKSIFFHISPTSPKKSINSSTSLLKSHTVATQALIGVMLKNDTEYRMPVVENAGKNV